MSQEPDPDLTSKITIEIWTQTHPDIGARNHVLHEIFYGLTVSKSVV